MRTHRWATDWRSWRKSYVLVAAVALACGPAANQSRPVPLHGTATKHVLVFSDLHFNPLADTSLVDALVHADVSRWRTILEGSSQKGFSQYGGDSNYPLFISSLTAMQRALPNAEVVLFAGDILPHNAQTSFKKIARDTSTASLVAFIDKTNQFVAQRIADAFPNAEVLPTLGNNDSVCGDYMSQPGSAFLHSFAEAWQPLVNRRGSAPDFVKTFSQAGHYSAYAPTLGVRVVVLNDVYLSARYSNSCGSPADHPGRDALAWLEGVLTDSRSRGERVWLLTHVPIGADVFATLKVDTLVNMLEPTQASTLISILRRFGSTVRYGVYGHTHMNEFRVILDSGGAPLIGNQGIPAVSPIFGNNPAFVVMSVDSTSGVITDYAVHALTNLAVAGAATPALWTKEYDFDRAFGLDGFSVSNLDRLHRGMTTDSILRSNFLRFYDSGSGRTHIAASWRAYWCSMEFLEPSSFTRCVRQP
jgi:sphingomyelin phosphodiesterase acid-like 3